MYIPLWATNFLRRMQRQVHRVKNNIRMTVNRLRDRNTGKKIVVVLSLDTLGPSPEVVRQAALQGLYVHVFAQDFPVSEAAFAHNWSRVDPRTDFDLALKIAKELDPIAILSETKNLLLPMQDFLAQNLGLKTVGARAAKTSNSKIELRKSLDEHGVANIPWIRMEDYREGEFGFPCVIKPDLGTSSKGVRFLTDHNDLMTNIKQSDELRKDPSVGDAMLIEGFVSGRQFDLEGLAIDGRYYLLCVVEEYFDAAPPYFPPAWFQFNPPISESLFASLWDTTQKALKALGVHNGSWHMEQRVDSGGTVRIIDYANRMGYNRLVSAASGLSFAGAYVELMTAKEFRKVNRTPKSLLQLFAFDESSKKSMKSFLLDHPEHVHSKSFFAFEASFHLYLGYMVVSFDRFAEQHALLSKYDLIPAQFSEFYPDITATAPVY
jgi:ATP-grasp domain-containing protein